jgi:hypothetical protein
MSFWIFGKKKHGQRMLYSVSVPWELTIALVAILIALLLPLIQFLRS